VTSLLPPSPGRRGVLLEKGSGTGMILRVDSCGSWWAVRPIKFKKNHDTRVSKQAHTAMRTCDETVLSITESENRIQTVLSCSFSGKNKIFVLLPC
jgi:hypothetical protein